MLNRFGVGIGYRGDRYVIRHLMQSFRVVVGASSTRSVRRDVMFPHVCGALRVFMGDISLFFRCARVCCVLVGLVAAALAPRAPAAPALLLPCPARSRRGSSCTHFACCCAPSHPHTNVCPCGCHRSANGVLVLSLTFIGVVVLLHIFGKLAK